MSACPSGSRTLDLPKDHDITLQDLQSRNVEAYVDDIVVKTRQQETFLRDLSKAFDSLRTTRLNLNPEKCVFRVPAGKLLGFL